MKRHLLTILLFLLMGAIANVAVAWGCALGGWPFPTAPMVTLDQNETQQLWNKLRAGWGPPAWPDKPVMLKGKRSEGSGCKFLQAYHPHDAPWVHVSVVHEIQVGFPALSLRYTTWRDGPQQPRRIGALATEDSVPLPLLPLWSGFTINTLFYATLLWLLIPGPFAMRRAIRRKRGQCPACGYPAGESAVCSECGKELHKGVRAAT